MRVKGRWHVTSKLLVLIGATAIASSQLIGTSARAADPIKVGWVGPLSPPGGYAEGALMKQAAEVAADELNAKGGVLGRPIKVIFVDTRGKPEEGTAAAERLISQEKVVAITGEFHSSVFLAEMEVAHKAGIPIIAVDVWALKITAKGYPEVFRVAPNQALIAAKYGDWMAAAGFKNVAVMFEKTDGGQSGRDVLLPVLDKHGIKYEVVGADPSATEFTAQIERFKSHQPPFDFFMTFYSEAGAYPLVSQSHTLGFAPTARTGMANSGGPAVDPTFWKNVGQAGKYLLTEIVGLPKAAWNDKTKAFGLQEEVQPDPVTAGDRELRCDAGACRRDPAREINRRQGAHRCAREDRHRPRPRPVHVLDQSRAGLGLSPVHERAGRAGAIRQGRPGG